MFGKPGAVFELSHIGIAEPQNGDIVSATKMVITISNTRTVERPKSLSRNKNLRRQHLIRYLILAVHAAPTSNFSLHPLHLLHLSHPFLGTGGSFPATNTAYVSIDQDPEKRGVIS